MTHLYRHQEMSNRPMFTSQLHKAPPKQPQLALTDRVPACAQSFSHNSSSACVAASLADSPSLARRGSGTSPTDQRPRPHRVSSHPRRGAMLLLSAHSLPPAPPSASC